MTILPNEKQPKEKLQKGSDAAKTRMAELRSMMKPKVPATVETVIEITPPVIVETSLAITPPVVVKKQRTKKPKEEVKTVEPLVVCE